MILPIKELGTVIKQLLMLLVVRATSCQSLDTGTATTGTEIKENVV